MLFLYNFVLNVEKWEIPHSFIINLDQKPLKYITAMNHMMATQDSKSVSIVGSSNKRCVTGITITLDDWFLSMQLIYPEKTKQRQKQPPRGVPWKRCSENMLLCNFIEITLRHGCSPISLLHIFRTPFLKNTSGWLFL